MDFDETDEKTVILIIDDNLGNLKLLSEYLKESGYKILIAEDGEEGLRHAKFALPDLILLDIMMPGIDGFETCCRLKENETTKDIPVIFMTAASETADKVRGFKSGATDYVTKPFEQEEVLARIATHLTIHRQKKALSELNAKLCQANSELTELNATKDKFFSIIAHDLKNALNTLLSGSELLAGSVCRFNREKTELFAKEMLSSVKNTFNLLENLLNWSRIQQGKMDIRPKAIDLYKLACHQISFFQKKAERKKIELSHSVKPDTFVYADLNMTDTILRNLISNAIKFTHNSGKITVSAQSFDEKNENHEFVKISVSDNGIGISAYNIIKLLKIECKYRTLGTDGEKGTGLGLILCKEFVRKNRGIIWIESEIGKGSTFSFTLPKVNPL
ncbi:hybrid sensor histidine kinase/response regulator [Desulfonema magnum]|uniref:histidine kinase n=1 Tax=Desulfonema magnum TaxID=45655 RepID=A0A975BFV7_9BACT|nr:hybrid sensor histidine kinase/response regulator [Desulfonema magnum]QTA84606.1 Two component system response regulator/histidine kinase [Desulfonema magnum]